jgi:hypothetical protein
VVGLGTVGAMRDELSGQRPAEAGEWEEPARSSWLTNRFGAPYRLNAVRARGAVGFEVMHQDGEGRLWRRLCDDAGAPRVVSLDIARAAVLALVGARRGGAIQLIPVRGDGQPTGSPPEMVHLRG